MISACKDAISRAYAFIGEGDDDAALKIADKLGDCGIRDSCPYNSECARKTRHLRDDAYGASDGLPMVSSLGLGRDPKPPV